MDDRASESFVIGGLMLKNKLRCKNRNFNCRQTKKMLDVDQLSFFMSSNIDWDTKDTGNVLKGFFFFLREFLLLLSGLSLCRGRFIPIMGFILDLLQFLIDPLRKLKRIKPLA